jgi:hypothetical protein
MIRRTLDGHGDRLARIERRLSTIMRGRQDWSLTPEVLNRRRPLRCRCRCRNRSRGRTWHDYENDNDNAQSLRSCCLVPALLG